MGHTAWLRHLGARRLLCGVYWYMIDNAMEVPVIIHIEMCCFGKNTPSTLLPPAPLLPVLLLPVLLLPALQTPALRLLAPLLLDLLLLALLLSFLPPFNSSAD